MVPARMAPPQNNIKAFGTSSTHTDQTPLTAHYYTLVYQQRCKYNTAAVQVTRNRTVWAHEYYEVVFKKMKLTTC